MSLNKEMYEKVRNMYTNGNGFSHAMDAYAQAYFSEPPLTGEWTETAMLQELDALLLEYWGNGIDLRRRSTKNILRDRLKDARYRLERAEQGWEKLNEECENMRSFIYRFRLDGLYGEYLKSIQTEAFHLHSPGDALPFT